MNKAIDKFMCNLEKVCVMIGCIGTAISFLIMSLQVITRHVLGNSFSWSEEISLLCMVYAAMFASITLFKYDTHPCVEILRDHYPPRLRAVMELLFHLIEVGVLYVLIKYGVDVVRRTSLAVLPSSQINRGILFYPIVIASAAHLLQVIVMIRDDIRKLIGKAGPEKEEET